MEFLLPQRRSLAGEFNVRSLLVLDFRDEAQEVVGEVGADFQAAFRRLAEVVALVDQSAVVQQLDAFGEGYFAVDDVGGSYRLDSMR